MTALAAAAVTSASCILAGFDEMGRAIATGLDSSFRPAVWSSPWAPDGSALLATHLSSGGLYRLEIDGESSRIADGPLTAASYSPDGSRIVCAAWGRPERPASLWTTGADGADPREIACSHQGWPLFLPAWSPDGSWIAYTGPEGLELVRADLSERRSLGPGLLATWSPDGTVVASTLPRRGPPETGGTASAEPRPEPWIQLHSVDGAPAVLLARGSQPSWSPDGRRLAFSDRRREGEESVAEVRVVDAAGGEPRTIATGSSPRWSPDGERILVLRRDASGTGLWTITPEGSDEWPLVAPADWGHWSPDGRRVAFGRGSEFLVIDADGSNERSLGHVPPRPEP